MLNTVVTQSRTTLLLPDGSSVYQLSVDVTNKGELPHPNLFVFQILDALDATRDTFTRVGNPYDLENIKTTRALALTNGQTYYLSPSMVKRYSDLSIATQSIDAIRSRVDNAVNAWYTYKTVFEGSEVYNHPTAEESYEQQLQDDYAEAKTARVAAEAVVTATDLALTLAQDEAADAMDLSNKYKQAYDFSNQSYVTYWGTYYGATNTLLAAMEARYTEFYDHEVANPNPALHGYIESMRTNLNAFRNLQGNGSSLNNSFGNFHVQVGGYYTAQQGVIATANVAAANAVTAKKEAEASLASAQAAEDAALAAVLAVCPDFDPSSV